MMVVYMNTCRPFNCVLFCRDGTYCYGGHDCMFVQLRPSFRLLMRKVGLSDVHAFLKD